VTKFDGQPADLDGRNPAYLWTHEGPHRGGPVVELTVIYDDEAVSSSKGDDDDDDDDDDGGGGGGCLSTCGDNADQ